MPAGGDTGRVQRLGNALSALRLFSVLLIVALFSTFVVIVPVGERGILLRLGAIQEPVLDAGVHLFPPVLFSVQTLSVRIESHQQKSEAATRDLQDVKIDLALQWHLPEEQVRQVYQNLGDSTAIINKVLEPAIEDSLKTVVAGLTAEQLITERHSFHQDLELVLSQRLESFGLAMDGVDLVQLDFSDRFRAAVEAKQVAEQDARRASYEAARAQRQAAARVYQAEGEAKAQELLQNGLTAEVLQRQAIEKWNGHLPLIVGTDQLPLISLQDLMKADRKQQRRP